jgi:Mor family transcriptional regulator
MESVPQAKTDRNNELVKDFDSGMLMVDLVAKYRISSVRIMQIVKRAKKLQAQIDTV